MHQHPGGGDVRVEDESCSVRSGSLARLGSPELELVWWVPSPPPLTLIPGEDDYGATLQAILVVDDPSNASPFRSASISGPANAATHSRAFVAVQGPRTAASAL